jgi:hypothetical protein
LATGKTLKRAKKIGAEIYFSKLMTHSVVAPHKLNLVKNL